MPTGFRAGLTSDRRPKRCGDTLQLAADVSPTTLQARCYTRQPIDTSTHRPRLLRAPWRVVARRGWQEKISSSPAYPPAPFFWKRSDRSPYGCQRGIGSCPICAPVLSGLLRNSADFEKPAGRHLRCPSAHKRTECLHRVGEWLYKAGSWRTAHPVFETSWKRASRIGAALRGSTVGSLMLRVREQRDCAVNQRKGSSTNSKQR